MKLTSARRIVTVPGGMERVLRAIGTLGARAGRAAPKRPLQAQLWLRQQRDLLMVLSDHLGCSPSPPGPKPPVPHEEPPHDDAAVLEAVTMGIEVPPEGDEHLCRGPVLPTSEELNRPEIIATGADLRRLRQTYRLSLRQAGSLLDAPHNSLAMYESRPSDRLPSSVAWRLAAASEMLADPGSEKFAMSPLPRVKRLPGGTFLVPPRPPPDRE